MTRNNSLIETTERFYRLFQQSKKQHTSTHYPFANAETKTTRLDDSEFITVQEGIELLPLWGDSQIGASGVMIRFAPNIAHKIYYQNVCFAMIISGTVKHWGEVQTEKKTTLLQVGDSWKQKAGNLHIEIYPTKETTLIYMHCDRPVEIEQMKNNNT